MNRSPAASSRRTSATRVDGMRQPTSRVPARWADVKPVPANSALVTAGMQSPPNAGSPWNATGSTEVRASPDAVRHRNRFNTSSSPDADVPTTRTRYPTTPWPAGASPVVIDVNATAVVVGTTDVIGPPAMVDITGANDGRSW